jgi:hypothetical protein
MKNEGEIESNVKTFISKNVKKWDIEIKINSYLSLITKAVEH